MAFQNIKKSNRRGRGGRREKYQNINQIRKLNFALYVLGEVGMKLLTRIGLFITLTNSHMHDKINLLYIECQLNGEFHGTKRKD